MARASASAALHFDPSQALDFARASPAFTPRKLDQQTWRSPCLHLELVIWPTFQQWKVVQSDQKTDPWKFEHSACKYSRVIAWFNLPGGGWTWAWQLQLFTWTAHSVVALNVLWTSNPKLQPSLVGWFSCPQGVTKPARMANGQQSLVGQFNDAQRGDN